MTVTDGRFGTEDAVGILQGFQSFQGDEFGFTGAEGYELNRGHSVFFMCKNREIINNKQDIRYLCYLYK